MANYVTYTTTVKLNTKEAQNQLEALQRKVSDLKQKRDEALSQGKTQLGESISKDLAKATKELKNFQRQTMTVSETLTNLESATVSQLRKAKLSLSKALANESDPEEYKRLSIQLQKVEESLKSWKELGSEATAKTQELVRETDNLSKVMANTQSASYNQLKQAQAYLKKSIADMKPDTTQYEIAIAQLKEVDAQVKKLEADQMQVNRLIIQYDKEIEEVNGDIQVTQRELGLVNRTLKNLDRASMRDLEYSIKILNQQLRGMDRGTAEFREMTRRVKELRQELERVRYEGSAQQSWLNRTADWFNKVQGVAIAAIASLTGISMTIRKCVSDFAKMDEAMTDVRKYTGQTKEEVKAMNEEFKRMDTRTPREKLNALAGDAGRLGIASTEMVEQFVDAADKINVALGDDLGDDAVKNIGKLAQMFGEDKKKGLNGAMLSTGSAVNELAQSSSASAGYLVDFTARLAGVGKQAGLTQQQIMGYASVLDQNMQQDETAATAFQNLIAKLFQDPAKFAKIAGIEVSNFTKLLKEDANQALLQFFDALKAKGGFAQLAPMFEAMNLDGSRAVGVLTVMADKLDDVKTAQNIANNAYSEGTSVINEFNTQMSSAQAQLDMAKKRFADISIELGEKLMPIARYAITGTSALIRGMSTMADVISKCKTTILALVVSIGVWTVATNLHTIKTKLLVFWNEKCIVSMVKLKALMMKNPWTLAITAVLTLVSVIIDLTRKTDELTAKQKLLNDVNKQAGEIAAEEMTKYKQLRKIVEDNNRSYKERKAALDELKTLVPEYHANLNAEGILINNNTDALDRYAESLIRAAKAQAAFDKMKGIQSNNIEHQITLEKRQGNRQWAMNKLSDMGLSASYQTNRILRGEDGKAIYEVIDKVTGKTKQLNSEQYKQFGHYRTLVEYNNKRIDQEQTLIDKNNENLDVLQKIVDEGKAAATTTKTATTTSTTTQYVDSKKAEAERKKREAARKKALAADVKAAKDATDKEQAENILAYQQGLITYSDFINKKHEIAINGYQALIDVYAKYGEDANRYAEDMASEMQKRDEDNLKMSLNNIERNRQLAIAQANIDYVNQASDIYRNDAALQERLFQIEVEASDARIAALKAGSEQWLDEKANREALDLEHQVSMQQYYADLLLQYKEEWGRRDVEVERKIALDGLESLYKQKLITTEQYESMLRNIRLSYDEQKSEVNLSNSKREVTSKNANSAYNTAKNNAKADYNNGDHSNLSAAITGDISVYGATMDKLKQMYQDDKISYEEYQQAKKLATSEFLEGMVSKAQAAFSAVNNLMSAASSYYAASSQYEQNVTSKKYDKLISAAEGNEVKQKRLEEKKQKELAKIKTKYSKKQMKMEIAQAYASTAMAAINAYASAAKEHWLLGAIAAAMATAAGMLQIATIKKQHAAEEAGYYEGGFTGGNRYRKEAGVVHEGEFVANHNAVNNPDLLPVLRLIDVAQRNNTVGSLTAADVSRQLGGGTVVAPIVNVSTDNGEMSSTLTNVGESVDLLRKVLDNGVKTYMVWDEFDKDYNKYKKLKDV